MLGETVFIFRMDIRPGVDHNLQFIRRDGFPPDGTKAIHICLAVGQVGIAVFITTRRNDGECRNQHQHSEGVPRRHQNNQVFHRCFPFLELYAQIAAIVAGLEQNQATPFNNPLNPPSHRVLSTHHTTQPPAFPAQAASHSASGLPVAGTSGSTRSAPPTASQIRFPGHTPD